MAAAAFFNAAKLADGWGQIAPVVGNIFRYLATMVTGADDKIVTGTAGTSGNVVMWDANGDAVDGSVAAAGLTTEALQDLVGAMVSGGTETGITVSYDDTNARLDFVVATQTPSITDGGNANAITIDSLEQVIFGHTAALTTFVNASTTPQIQIHGNANATGSGQLAVVAWNTTDAYGSALRLAKSASAGIGTYTALAANETIGTLNFEGADGDEFQVFAQMTGEVDATVGDADAPGRMIFKTTADGGIALTEAFRIDSAQLTIFQKDRALRLNNQTSAAAASIATFTNAPTAGNPIFYLKVNVNGTNGAIPVLAEP